MSDFPCTGLCTECHEQCAADDAEEWRELAAELRVQESRISGLLCDVNWCSDDQVREALVAINDIINVPCSTSDQPKEGT